MPQRTLTGRLALLLALLTAPAALAQPGALDPTFGGDGLVIAGIRLGGAPGAVLLQPDGRVVVVGNSGFDAALARYFADGTLDPSFGDGGIAVHDLGFSSAGLRAAVLQPDGKIVAGGVATVSGGEASFLARFLPDGALDPTFGSGGFVVYDTALFGATLFDLALLPDGKILTLDSFQQPGTGRRLTRLLPDGALDPAFGNGGVTTLGAFASAPSLAVLPDGKIVLAGIWAGSGAALLRYHADGSVDATFGTEGRVDLLPGTSDQAMQVLVRPDGRFVVLLWGAPGGSPFSYQLAQRLPDGAPDPAFGGGDGYVAFDFPFALNGEPVLARGADGRLFVASATTGNVDHFLARHLADGALDPAFGDGGYVVNDFGDGLADGAVAVVPQPDGRVLTGSSVSGLGSPQILARFFGDAAVAVSAAPDEPAVIPPGGGAFRFTLHLANATDQPQTVEVWTEAVGPASQSPLLGPRVVTLAPYATLTRVVRQRVPGAAPAGDYTYSVHAGAFPGGAVTAASFPATKGAGALAARAPGSGAAWTAEGWDDAPTPASASEAPVVLSLSAPSPHPFREGARLTLSVPSAQPARVVLYDALGRQVAVLHDGPLAAGPHALALNGRALAPGVYVVRAEGLAGVAVRRIVRY